MNDILENKKTATVWHILDAPPVYLHALATNKLFSYPPEALRVPSLSMSDTNTKLLHRLIDRIWHPTNKERREGCLLINYKNLCQYCEIDISTTNKLKKNKQKLREKFEKILPYYKKMHFIGNYKEYKDVRSVAGVEIKIIPEKRLLTAKRTK